MTTAADLLGTPPTPKQRAIYRWMAGFFAKHQAMPSFRQIGAAFGIRSPNGVNHHINALVSKGLLEWDGVSRMLRFVGVTFEPAFGEDVIGQQARALWED